MANASSSDPKGWVKNPPSTIVKVVGTTRADINESLGVVVQYDAERSRYMVHLTKNQQMVAMKSDNLTEASMIEKGQAYFQLTWNDPQVRRILANVTARLPPGVSLKQIGVGVGLLFVALIYFLGFSRTLILVSFSMIVLTIIGPDLLEGARMQTIVRNAPERFKTIVRDSMPGGTYIADKPYALAGLAALMLVFFVKGMLSAPSSGGSGGGFDSMFSSSTAPQRQLIKTPEEYYKLGFDDAAAQKEFGTSLPVEETPPVVDGNMDYPDYPIPAQPQPSLGSKLFSLSSAMSMMYIGRTVMQLGRGADGQWSFPLLKANLANMETWQLGLLGLSLYRFVKIFF